MSVVNVAKQKVNKNQITLTTSAVAPSCVSGTKVIGPCALMRVCVQMCGSLLMHFTSDCREWMSIRGGGICCCHAKTVSVEERREGEARRQGQI